MMSFWGMVIGAGMVAIGIEKLYSSIVHSASTVAEAGRYAIFTGTWTTLGSAIGVHGIRGKARLFRKRVNKVHDLTKNSKEI